MKAIDTKQMAGTVVLTQRYGELSSAQVIQRLGISTGIGQTVFKRTEFCGSTKKKKGNKARNNFERSKPVLKLLRQVQGEGGLWDYEENEHDKYECRETVLTQDALRCEGFNQS